MAHLSSPAIMLRTIEHGENDKIITAFTLHYGKLSCIAKGAKKSQKRFGGALEIFSSLNLMWSVKQKKGLPLLQEASIIHPFDKIRHRYDHMVFASHWCELVYRWMDEGKKQQTVCELLQFSLEQLEERSISPEVLHLMFQLHFLSINGFQPNLKQCTCCHTPIGDRSCSPFFLDVSGGGIACEKCHGSSLIRPTLSTGTVKQLQWVLHTPLSKLHRMRFTRKAVAESLTFLEAFILHHMGKETRSMKLVKQLALRQPQSGRTPTSRKANG